MIMTGSSAFETIDIHPEIAPEEGIQYDDLINPPSKFGLVSTIIAFSEATLNYSIESGTLAFLNSSS